MKLGGTWLEKDGGKKGAKGKKGKKGKGKKGKKAVKAPTVPEKSIAKVHMFKFDDEEKFLAYLSVLDLSLPLFVLFHSSQDSIVSEFVEQEIIKFMRYMQQDPDSKDLNYVAVNIDPEKLGMSGLQQSPKVRLDTLPTLLKWGGAEKLVGTARCTNQGLLCLLFEDVARRTDCLDCDYNRFTDNNKILCPYLPSLEEQAAPPPLPPVEVVKAPKSKAAKKKDKKKGGKKGGKKKKK